MIHPALADPRRLRGCLVDMGSVVFDERLTWRRWQTLALQALRDAKRPVSASQLRQAIRDAIRARPPGIGVRALEILGTDPSWSPRFWAEAGNQDRPAADANEALSRLSSRMPLVMVANQALAARQRVVDAGLERYFRRLILSEEVGISKPDERIYWLGLEALGCVPEEVAMIGDRLDLDIAPARRLGLLAVRVRRGPFYWQSPLCAEERPHLTVPTLAAAARWLVP